MTNHQSGSLKQSNKQHKGAKSSKRAFKRGLGAGRVANSANPSADAISAVNKKRNGSKYNSNVKSSHKDARINRLNRERQLKNNKKADVMLQKRVGSVEGVPKIVGIVPLSAAASAQKVLAACLLDASWSTYGDMTSSSSKASSVTHAFYAKTKSSITYALATNELFSILDTIKTCDVVLFAVDTNVNDAVDLIDANGQTAISALLAIGCPNLMCCVSGLEVGEDASSAARAQMQEMRRVVHKQVASIIGDDVQICDCCDSQQLARLLAQASSRDVGWRSIRSYLLADSVEVVASSSSDGSCSLRVGGYLRGRPLCRSALVYIAGAGAASVASVELPAEGGPLEQHYASLRRRGGAAPCSDGPAGAIFIASDVTKQDSLEMESAVDALMGEQTWPSDAEMAARPQGDDGAGRSRRNVPQHIPAGMSSYQADWLVDEEGAWNEDDEGDGDGDGDAMADDEPPETSAPFELDGEDEMDDNFTIDGSALNGATGNAAVEEKRRLRALAQEDDEFPDEVDTPPDVAARQRFARYRNLQSFRSSPWHPRENLPPDYARIFQFENFPGAQRRILAEGRAADAIQEQEFLRQAHKGGAVVEMTVGEGHDDAGLLPRSGNSYIKAGAYVFITVTNVAAAAAREQLAKRGTLSLFSLLTHENKLSVLHFNVTRSAGFTDPIKSKEDMVMYTGFRTFDAKPIYSESNLNCDKHKMERFFRHDRFTVASVYAPITFLPCPLLMFKQTADGRMVLAATGSLSSVDPDRIILKKIILTGLPIRVRRRFAVVKHLFYDTQDVRWFKPAELCTKRGLRGHIREPVGTHGLLKAIFSGPITQNDTVMLILYKRVFPKFPPAGRVSSH